VRMFPLMREIVGILLTRQESFGLEKEVVGLFVIISQKCEN
jgi:hypothetical protein